MEERLQNFGMDLGRRAISRDWEGVRELLAPWLRAKLSASDVQAFFEDGYRDILSQNGIEEVHYPEYPDPDVGGNSFTNPTELRKPISFLQGKVRQVPPELTDEDFRYWMKVQLQCSDDQMEKLGVDYLAEVWMAVVETPEGLRAGYWSQGAY